MPQTIKLKDAGKRLRLKKMQIAGFKAGAAKNGRVLVGFYKDKDGKTKPLTRSAREINRKKVVKRGKQFRGVKPLHARNKPLHARKEFQWFADQFEEHYPFGDYASIRDEIFQHVLGEWLENANVPKAIWSPVRKAIYSSFKQSKKPVKCDVCGKSFKSKRGDSGDFGEMNICSKRCANKLNSAPKVETRKHFIEHRARTVNGHLFKIDTVYINGHPNWVTVATKDGTSIAEGPPNLMDEKEIRAAMNDRFSRSGREKVPTRLSTRGY